MSQQELVMNKLSIGICLVLFLIFSSLLTGCLTKYENGGYIKIDGPDLQSSPIYPKIHLELKNSGNTDGKDVQQKFVLTLNKRQVHEEMAYFGDIPSGETRTKDIIVELNLGETDLAEIRKNSKYLDLEITETSANGRVIENGRIFWF